MLNHRARNLACWTDLSFSLERVATHFPILTSLPSEEAVRLLKCLKSHSSTVRSSAKSWMSKGLSSPITGRRKLLTTPSKVMVSSPIEKKNMCREGDQRHTRCIRPLASLKPSKFLDITTDFRIPACSKHPVKSPSNSSSSTHRAQLVILLGTKSKKIETTSQDPRLIWRSRISLWSGTLAELANPDYPKTPRCEEGKSVTMGDLRKE